MSSEQRSRSLIEPRLITLTILVLLAALARTIDHGIPNFAPIGAIALFGGACFGSRKLAFLVPGLALLASDLILNSGRYQNLAPDAWSLLPFTAASFALVVLLGFGFRGRRRSTAGILIGSLAASCVFFVVSNLGWWLVCVQPQTLSTLGTTYAAAIPFFHHTVLGDIFFNTVLFGTLAMAESRFVAIRPVEAA